MNRQHSHGVRGESRVEYWDTRCNRYLRRPSKITLALPLLNMCKIFDISLQAIQK